MNSQNQLLQAVALLPNGLVSETQLLEAVNRVAKESRRALVLSGANGVKDWPKGQMGTLAAAKLGLAKAKAQRAPDVVLRWHLDRVTRLERAVFQAGKGRQRRR